jgi:hypothetical protein
MARLSVLTGFVLALLVLAVGNGHSGESKGGAKKIGLPKYWNKIGLSDEQKKKIIKITTEYQTKITALQEQINKLKKDEQTERFNQLTEEQKSALRRIIAEKSGVVEKAPEKKFSVEKKSAKDKDK